MFSFNESYMRIDEYCSVAKIMDIQKKQMKPPTLLNSTYTSSIDFILMHLTDNRFHFKLDFEASKLVLNLVKKNVTPPQ